MGKNKSLKVGIVWKGVPIEQENEKGEVVIETIFVRGLSPADLSAIMREDGGDGLALLYRRLTTEATTPEDVVAIGAQMLEELPDLAAHIIARAGGLPDQWEDVRDFATGAQLELLKTVAQLTFKSESVGKKLMEIVEKYGRESLAARPSPKVSKTGSGASESR